MSFTFKQFSILDGRCAMKVGTDGVLLGAWAKLPEMVAPCQTDGQGGKEIRHAIDLGAGSGVISLMIAQRYPEAMVVGVEIDPDAAADCAKNFANSPFSSRLTAVCAPAEKFMAQLSGAHSEPIHLPDLIITNPPFFSNGALSPSKTRRQARHEGEFGPMAAIETASRYLSSTGSLAMITPADCEDSLLFHAELHRLHLWRLCRVSTIEGRPASRLLWQFSRLDLPSQTNTLAIRTPSGTYTDSYVHLTRDFYLNF